MKQLLLTAILALAMVTPALPHCKDCPHHGNGPKSEDSKECGHHHGKKTCCQKQGQQGGSGASQQQAPKK